MSMAKRPSRSHGPAFEQKWRHLHSRTSERPYLAGISTLGPNQITQWPTSSRKASARCLQLPRPWLCQPKVKVCSTNASIET